MVLATTFGLLEKGLEAQMLFEELISGSQGIRIWGSTLVEKV